MPGRIVKLLLPVSCPCCGSEIRVSDKGDICPGCRMNLEVINSYGCLYCGRPVRGPGLCGRCGQLEVTSNIDAFYIACIYGLNVKKIIINFKYGRRRYLAGELSEILAGCWEELQPRGFDFLLPVPLHKTRQRERGYNQSLELARRLSGVTGLPVSRGVLTRERKTMAQVSLGRRSRSGNVSGAFRASRRASGGRFILIDDVATTGSTLRECAAALKKSGALRVGALAVAHGR